MNRYIGPALRADWESLGTKGQALARALHDFDCECGSYTDGEYTEVALRAIKLLELGEDRKITHDVDA